MPLSMDEQRRAQSDPRYGRLYASRDRREEMQRAYNNARQLLRTAEEVGDEPAAEQARAEMDDLDVRMRNEENLQNRIRGTILGEQNLDSALGFVNRPEVEAQLGSWASTTGAIPNTNVGWAMDVDQVRQFLNGDLAPSTSAAVSGVDTGSAFTGIGMPPPRPPRSFANLFAADGMPARSIDFLQRQGVNVGAAIAAPGSVKAEAQIQYINRRIEAVVLAVHIRLLRQDLFDIDGFQASVQDALVNDTGGVLPLAEDLLLNGDDAADVEGILNSTGVIATDVTGVTEMADKVAKGVATLALTGVAANFVCVNPLDAFLIRTAKESGSGGYLGTSAITPPLIESAALAQGTALVGNSAGARFRVREGLSVTIGTDSDDLTKNRVTCLVETRLVPQVDQPGMFARVPLA